MLTCTSIHYDDWLTKQYLFVLKGQVESSTLFGEKPAHFTKEEILKERELDVGDALTGSVEKFSSANDKGMGM